METLIRQTLCKNAALSVVESEGQLDAIKNDGCKNQRRHSSAYCQECSDKHGKTK